MRKTSFGITAGITLIVAAVAAIGCTSRSGLNQNTITTPEPQERIDGATASRRTGAIPHAPLLKTVLPDTSNLEVAVYEAEYLPGGRNPRHLHPAAITFYVVSGSGVWQEEGQPPVTLRAGDSLLVPAGTIHAHWNPSTTENLRFVEFIVAEKDRGRSIPQPMSENAER